MGIIKNLKEEVRIIRERDPAIHSSLEEGIFLGDQIIPRVNFLYETGIVTYDARTRMHYITCEHDITCEQKLQIIKDFDIDEDMVSVIKQGLPRTKRRRKTGLEQGESTCAAG